MKKGVLLVNLGSPDTPEPKDVKRYLDEFLMDERVIDFPYILRAILVKGIVLNTRPKKSAEAYGKIWWEEGSPLIVLSERLQEKIDSFTSVPIALGMRYGSMTMEKAMKELSDQGVTEVLLVPLYPQFAMATTETIVVKADELRQEKFPHMSFTQMPPFYNHPDYIRVLSESVRESLEGKDYEHLLFSYHGIPKRHIRKSDITNGHCKMDGKCCSTPSPAHEFCYSHQCKEVTRLVGEYLEMEEGTFSTSFQSRLGFDPWLTPYTDRTIERMGLGGTTKMAIATPAFVSDCLETLEEIAMEGKEEFLKAGGEAFYAIPCINDNDDWVDVLVNWIEE
jgi:ferrochelatase